MNDGDPYLIPGTNVLRNNFGVTSQAQLDDIERRITSLRVAELRARPIPGAYDFDHLCAFHRHIFQDVYDWAGTVRTTNLAKGRSVFCLAAHLASSAEAVFSALKDEAPLSKDRPTAATRIAHHLAEVNALHPFREGNGRAQRAFFWQFAIEQGWELRWDGVDPDENVAAFQESMHSGNGRLSRLVETLLAPVLPV